jgi:hypothetical protein
MKILTPLLALVFLAGPASAHQAPCDQQKKAAEARPDARAAAKAPPKRRAVRQVIEPTPRIAAPVTEAYRPSLTPPYPASTMAGVPGAASPMPSSMPPPTVPPPPVQVGTCGAGGCTDTSGTRYTGGVGTTVLDPQGRNCTRTGTTIQCF